MKSVINGLSVNTTGDSKNTPIIFLHGFPFDHTMWANHMDALSAKYYCISYDIRGLGESYVGDGQYTMEFFVDDLFSVMYNLSIDKAILCGLSMGGYIALRAVERDQSRFKSLILCDTKSQADDNTAKVKRAEGINQINTEGLNIFVESFVRSCFSPETIEKNPDVVNDILSSSKLDDPLGVKGCLLAMLSRTDTTGYLGKIKIPALLLAGVDDDKTPPELMQKMSAKISKSEFAAIPHAGHLAPVENPGVVNNIISSFLDKRFKK